jgi:hypothetical protein
MNELPGYVWATVWIGVVGLPAVTLVAIGRGAGPAGVRTRTAAGALAVGGAVWAGWLAGVAVLGGAGVYRGDEDTPNPWIPITLGTAVAVLLLAARTPAARRMLADAGAPARLAVPQTFRVVGGVFLMVAALGELPAVFAVPAGIGDIAIGVAAPVVAWRLARGGGRRGAVWFNVLGIVDLAVAVGIGFLAAPGPANLLSVTPSTEAVTMLPLVLVPATAVPLALALHLVSLARLRRAAPGAHGARTGDSTGGSTVHDGNHTSTRVNA